jgi:pyruvate/oxaloacetate carboxyltransferase
MDNQIHFVDQTLRDAQQSLWGFTMRTDHMEPIAEMMDKVGYTAIATVGSQAFTVQVRNLNEDPWERIRILSGRITKTPLRGSYQIGSLSSFDLSTPREIITLWIKRSVANGIRSFWICDYQYEMEKFIYFARIARSEGAELVPALMYTSSPVHTRDYWARKTRALMEAGAYIDRIMIEDASGVITPEATVEMVQTVRENSEGLPLEFHSHCNSGLAPLCYLEAVKAGVRTLHTAVAPLANGTSLPAVENILKNLRRMGYSADLDEEALGAVSAHFRRVAQEEGLPTGIPMEFDLFHFQHQVPGGMMTNLTRQLKEVGMEHRLNEILEEVVRVRKDFGYPVMATPYSQIVGAQAVENVISGERYSQMTDEAVKYILGNYGGPDGPVDQYVIEQVRSSPRAKQFLHWKPEGYEKPIEEFRRELGPELSDDDLLLKILIPGKPVRKNDKPKTGPSPKPKSPPAREGSGGGSREFVVDVDGETFHVRVSEVTGESGEDPAGMGGVEVRAAGKPTELPQGGVPCGMAGLVLSIEAREGSPVKEGDLVVIIEAMKMRRHIHSPRSGLIKAILVQEGQMVAAEDILMVVE